MAQERRVLLTRPHAIVVGEMKPLLLESGYTPVEVSSPDDPQSALTRPANSAVISMPVSSSIGADAVTVFARLREGGSSLPGMFAGMGDVVTIRLTAGRAVGPVVTDAAFCEACGWWSRLARRREFLALRKEDQTSAEARQRAPRALRLLFGWIRLRILSRTVGPPSGRSCGLGRAHGLRRRSAWSSVRC